MDGYSDLNLICISLCKHGGDVFWEALSEVEESGQRSVESGPRDPKGHESQFWYSNVINHPPLVTIFMGGIPTIKNNGGLLLLYPH